MNAYSSIPEEMKALKRWCLFRVEQPKKPGAKPPKVPYQRGCRYKASSTNPKTWTSFSRVHPVPDGFHGINFAFAAEDRLTCVDLDHCRNTTGEVKPWAEEIIERIGSYCEVSYSGTGFHIILRGNPLPHGYKHGDIELYSSAKFISVTGDAHELYLDITDHDISWLIERIEKDRSSCAQAGARQPRKFRKLGAADESAKDWGLLLHLIRKLRSRDVDLIEREFARRYPERYASRSLAKGRRIGEGWYRYEIRRLLEGALCKTL